MYDQFWDAAKVWQRVAMNQMTMSMSAAMVINQRVMMMGLGIMKPEEATRMVLEKNSAMALGFEQAMRAMAANRGGAAVMEAAMKPVTQRVSANARRLTGPKGRKRR